MKIEPIQTSEEVIFYDTDSGGVVSNIAYLRYVEKARCALFDSIGFPLSEMASNGVYPTVVRTEIDYRKPATLGDRLVVEAKVCDIKKLRIQCGFQVKAADSDDIYAECEQTIVLVKLPEGKPVKPPADWEV